MQRKYQNDKRNQSTEKRVNTKKINNEVSIIYDVNNKNLDKSENIYNDLDTIIEKNIEKKINNLLETLPNNIDKDKIKEQKKFYDLSLRELYKNTLQTIRTGS